MCERVIGIDTGRGSSYTVIGTLSRGVLTIEYVECVERDDGVQELLPYARAVRPARPHDQFLPRNGVPKRGRR